jgi:hypothetical protein
MNMTGNNVLKFKNGVSIDFVWKLISSAAWIVVALVSFFVAPYLSKIDIAYDRVLNHDVRINNLEKAANKGERWTKEDHNDFVINDLQRNYATKYWVHQNFVEK